MEIIYTIAIFVGAWLFWTVGYNLNGWVSKLLSYRVRTTDTHLVIEPATPLEIKREYDREVYELENFVNPLTCRECGLQDLNGTHHPVEGNPFESDEYFRRNQTYERVNDEETIEINTFADNIKYVDLSSNRNPRSRRPPYHDYLDL